MAKDPNKIQDAIKQTRNRLGDAIDTVVNKSDVAARVSDTVNDTASALKERLTGGADTLGRAADTTREGLPEASDLGRGARNPLAIVIGAAAVGFLAGLVVPLSDAERVRLEPIGDDLAQRATEARDEIVEQGRAVVTETMSAARGSVQKHGEELASNLGVDSTASQPKGDVDAPASRGVETSQLQKAVVTKPNLGETSAKPSSSAGAAAPPSEAHSPKSV